MQWKASSSRWHRRDTPRTYIYIIYTAQHTTQHTRPQAPQASTHSAIHTPIIIIISSYHTPNSTIANLQLMIRCWRTYGHSHMCPSWPLQYSILTHQCMHHFCAWMANCMVAGSGWGGYGRIGDLMRFCCCCCCCDFLLDFQLATIIIKFFTRIMCVYRGCHRIFRMPRLMIPIWSQTHIGWSRCHGAGWRVLLHANSNSIWLSILSVYIDHIYRPTCNNRYCYCCWLTNRKIR